MVRVSVAALLLGLSALPATAQYVGRKAGPDDGSASTPDTGSRFAPEPRASQPFQSTPTPSPSPSPSPSSAPAASAPSMISPSMGISSRFAPDFGRSSSRPSYSAPEPAYNPGGGGAYQAPSYQAPYYQEPAPFQPPPPSLPAVMPRNVMVPDPYPQPGRMQAPASQGSRWSPPSSPYAQPSGGMPDPNAFRGAIPALAPSPQKSYAVPMPRPRVSPWGPEAPPARPPAATAANGPAPVPPPSASPPAGMAHTPQPGRPRPPRPGREPGPPQPPGNRLEASNDDLQRLRGFYGVQRKLDDRQVAFRRPDGVDVISEYDGKGHLRRRFRRHPDGHERPLIDPSWIPSGIDPYADGYPGVAGLLPPTFPERSSEYVVSVGPAEAPSPQAMNDILDGAPIEPLARAYALEEIVASLPLRQRMPRAEMEAQIFPANSSTPTAEGAARLEGIASTMRAILLRSPDEIFLVEGHTDTGGDASANLTLSLARAESVAAVLTQTFGIPAENMVTQGYGERFPPEGRPGTDLRNRRITIRRITPLLRPPTGA